MSRRIELSIPFDIHRHDACQVKLITGLRSGVNF